MDEKGAGVLLPIFSLPSPFGIGDFGGVSYKFIDILEENKFKYWQILPITPVEKGSLFSPYMSSSAFAGNFLFISPYKLIKEGLLDKSILKEIGSFKEDYVEYEKVYEYKYYILDIAFNNFKKNLVRFKDYFEFLRDNEYWLTDYSLFCVLKKEQDFLWCDWDKELKNRDERVLEKLKEKYENEIEREKFIQYIFFKQFFEIKNYAKRKGIKIIGDLPIYVSFDSADVWANPYIFKLDNEKKPIYVAGVPPDYFSEDGQLWGNPVYNWEVLKEQNFDFWIKRIYHNLKLFDVIRIDHFRGFVGYYQIPYGRSDARVGHWEKAPAKEFFELVFKKFGKIDLIAEDLGYITEDVIETMKIFNIPGMRVFQFGFLNKDLSNIHLPHNYPYECCAYSSTHDTNTLLGWLEEEIKESEKEFLIEYVGRGKNNIEIIDSIKDLLISSKSKIVIFPVQDIILIGDKGRINRPGRKEGNWVFRLTAENFKEFSKRMKDMMEKIVKYKRY
ncbi:MAG: 4-alpha-glucanotransferase [Candidatus Hydrothermales bacterium]